MDERVGSQSGHLRQHLRPPRGQDADHGMIALGANLDKAMWLAVELETIARQYYLSLALGSPCILSDEEIAETARGFSTYGLQAAQPKPATKARASVAKAAARRSKKQLSGKR